MSFLIFPRFEFVDSSEYTMGCVHTLAQSTVLLSDLLFDAGAVRASESTIFLFFSFFSRTASQGLVPLRSWRFTRRFMLNRALLSNLVEYKTKKNEDYTMLRTSALICLIGSAVAVSVHLNREVSRDDWRA